MKAELKEAWTTALRSGEYAQAKYALCRVVAYDPTIPIGYCCLGVLVEVDPNTNWDDNKDDKVITTESDTTTHKTFRGALGTLPYNYQEEVGLEVAAMELLMDMNDLYSNTFPEIADWIDENIPVD